MTARVALSLALVATLLGGLFVVLRSAGEVSRIHVVGYFSNSNGMFAGDEVRILGVPVGKIAEIEPQAQRVKITFWYESQYRVPADVNAVILSPSLVTARAIQLTPAYTGGPELQDQAVIPEERTAVPLEFDDLRVQLKRLTEALQPTQPGGVSTLGAFVNTAADNLRGQGANIRDTIIQLSQAFSAFGDHSRDIFGTIKNLSILVSALENSTGVIEQLNQNLASVSALLANDPDEVENAVRDINSVIIDVTRFIADNRETMGTASDRLASISTALVHSLDDIEQTLHVAPNTIQNFLNIYQPAQAAGTGSIVMNNFANPITFLCGAIQAASRLNAEQAAKLCVQYLAPIVKNRQFNFPPIGFNPIVGATARPNEVTYSEQWMRPDYVPPQSQPPNTPVTSVFESPNPEPLPAQAPIVPAAPELHADGNARPTNPGYGLPGMMIPPGSGS